MKVFSCRVQIPYGGGIIIVAANSREEAYLTAAHDKRYFYLFEWVNNEEYVDYSESLSDNNILHSYSERYPFAFWKEEKSLIANVEAPQVLIESSYCE